MPRRLGARTPPPPPLPGLISSSGGWACARGCRGLRGCHPGGGLCPVCRLPAPDPGGHLGSPRVCGGWPLRLWALRAGVVGTASRYVPFSSAFPPRTCRVVGGVGARGLAFPPPHLPVSSGRGRAARQPAARGAGATLGDTAGLGPAHPQHARTPCEVRWASPEKTKLDPAGRVSCRRRSPRCCRPHGRAARGWASHGGLRPANRGTECWLVPLRSDR